MKNKVQPWQKNAPVNILKGLEMTILSFPATTFSLSQQAERDIPPK